MGVPPTDTFEKAVAAVAEPSELLFSVTVPDISILPVMNAAWAEAATRLARASALRVLRIFIC